MIKVAGARTGCRIVDHAIQVYGAEGLSQDTPLAQCYAAVRSQYALLMDQMKKQFAKKRLKLNYDI